jgi:hypothetical protein
MFVMYIFVFLANTVVHATELQSTSQAVEARPVTTTSKNIPSDCRGSTHAEGRHSSDHRFVDTSEILEFSIAKKFVPTLQEADSPQAGVHGKGARETVAWFYGMRPFNGHPHLKWPAPDMVLRRFGSAHAWASKVTDQTDPNGKLSKLSVALLVNRFSILQAISEFINETCPQHCRSYNGRPDYQGALQHAAAMDASRGSASYNSWWDRVRVNHSAGQQAHGMIRFLPALKVKLPRLSEKDVQDITIFANQALVDSKNSKDGLGESHIKDGRQRFAAADNIKGIELILKRAGSSIKQILSKKPETGFLTSELVSSGYFDPNDPH